MRLNNITYAGTCLFLCDVVVMRFIPPPNGSSYFEASAIFGMVILMTFVATLQIYGIASRNFILVSLCLYVCICNQEAGQLVFAVQ